MAEMRRGIVDRRFAALPSIALASRARTCLKGCSSVGRASVSKTEGRGFESLRPCQADFQTCISVPPSRFAVGWRAAAAFLNRR